MLKNISNLGKTLNKAEQKNIIGGRLTISSAKGWQCCSEMTGQCGKCVVTTNTDCAGAHNDSDLYARECTVN